MVDNLFLYIDEEFKRLRLMENAVINYSGGLIMLTKRIRFQQAKLIGCDPEIESLLNDLANYLRDITVAGRLTFPEKEHD